MTIKILLISTLSCVFLANSKAQNLEVGNLRCEYKTNPLGVNEVNPRLSWTLTSQGRNEIQTAYQIIVASTWDNLENEIGDLWNSGKVLSSETNHIYYDGSPLDSRDRCYWKVKVWDKNNQSSAWSDAAEWTMGLLNRWDWKAFWIGFETKDHNQEDDYDLPPSPYLVKGFTAEGDIEQALLYITALGQYEASINGNRIGKDYLSPGWTDYNKRIHYQIYDVTAHVKKGGNQIGAILSEGWYAGYVGFGKLNPYLKDKYFYGETPRLLAQLEIKYEDGNSQVIISDDSWKATTGPILESDMQMGVTYDARKEMDGWNMPGYKASNWKKVQVFPGNFARLLAHPGEPVQITDTIVPTDIKKRPDGSYIFNMGQNFAGIVKLKVKGPEGTRVVLRFGEMLHLDGSLMTENLRMARATDTYILKGDPEGEEWMPNFTFHGFQYVEVNGYPGKPDKESITGFALSSATKPASSFSCSSPMINQLYKNIVWTQKANFIDIPTDCPQRDERLGWTGDAQIYVRSATLNMDVASFFKKWLADLNDSQWPDGPYPNFSPTPYLRIKHDYSPGWSEAGIIVPYEIYKAYGDTKIIHEYYPNMQKQVAFLIKKSAGKYYFPENSFNDILPAGGWGDWLSIGKETPKDMIATFYFAYSVKLMAEMAKAAGKLEDYAFYQEVFSKICTAFIENYVEDDGKILTAHTQTAYANVLYIGMFPGELEEKAGMHLAELIRENGGKLTTGFLGVKQLLPALSKVNQTELAYNLILEEDYPSWGYEIVNGATTIWERWNSYTHENGFVAGMNSFSHYAFGSVCEWMFANMAGINADEAGYKKIRLRPEVLENKINYVNAGYSSVHGEIRSDWSVNHGKFEWEIQIPANTSATIYIPGISKNSIKIDGEKLRKNKNVILKGQEGNYTIIESGSGKYHISSTL